MTDRIKREKKKDYISMSIFVSRYSNLLYF